MTEGRRIFSLSPIHTLLRTILGLKYKLICVYKMKIYQYNHNQQYIYVFIVTYMVQSHVKWNHENAYKVYNNEMISPFNALTSKYTIATIRPLPTCMVYSSVRVLSCCNFQTYLVNSILAIVNQSSATKRTLLCYYLIDRM